MSSRAQITGLVALALVLRLAVALTLPLPLSGDADGYDKFGFIFATTGRFDDVNGQPLVYRSPGYPFVVGSIYWLAGRNPIAVTVFQACVDSLFIFFLYSFVRARFSSRVALAASVLWAFSPSAIFTTGLLLSESFGTSMAFLAAALVLFGTERRSWGALVVAGLLCAALTLLRSMMVLFPAVLAFAVLFAKTVPFKQRVVMGLVVCASYGLTLAPWLARNAAIIGAPKLSTNGGDTFYAGWVHPPGQLWGNNVRDENTALAATMSPVEADAFLYKKTFEHIRADPLGALKLVPQKVILLLAPWDHEVVGRGRSRSWNVLWPVLAVLALLGLRERELRYSVVGVIGWGGFLLILAMSVAFYGCPRYRAPFEGLLIIPAALALERLWSMYQARRRSRVAQTQ